MVRIAFGLVDAVDRMSTVVQLHWRPLPVEGLMRPGGLSPIYLLLAVSIGDDDEPCEA
jgi:hypothetical protein